MKIDCHFWVKGLFVNYLFCESLMPRYKVNIECQKYNAGTHTENQVLTLKSNT